ncbi:hypothetical protein KHS38_11525 [Mucilaginibacter sp. Bleaf8]|nr:hypothetical protein [Mucilaginibacter sp. Bleaf8]MBS7565035.1 hypothetical protein [Mucilaginibacter sp. Bleaf8]
METLNTSTKVLLKAIDFELKALLQRELQAYYVAQLKKKGIDQGTGKQAA